MNAPHTQSNEEDAVARSNDTSLSTIAILQQCSSGRDEWVCNNDTRKRARSAEDDPMCEESNGNELNEQALDDGGSDDGGSDDGGSDDGESDDGRSETCIANQHSSMSKRRCTGNTTENTGIWTAVNFARTLDANAVDLEIADGSLIKVSKTILMQVLYFNTFFSKTGEQPTYSLSGDHPLAFRIVLAVLHHKLELLPSRITFRVLAQLAAVCDKYGTTDLVLPHVESRNWMNDLWKEEKPTIRSWTSWLRAAYIFRTRNSKEKGNSIYRKVLDVLAANLRMQDGKWYLERGESPLKVSIIPCPTGLYPLHETLCKRRETLWGAFLDDCRMQQDVAMKHIRPDYRYIGELAVLRYSLRDGLFLEESLEERLVKSRNSLGRDAGANLDLWIRKLAFLQ